MRERLGCSAEGSDCGGNSMVRAFSILPNVMEVMKYIGAAYILWLAIHIAFHTIHNYIDTKEMILRKGSILFLKPLLNGQEPHPFGKYG